MTTYQISGNPEHCARWYQTTCGAKPCTILATREVAAGLHLCQYHAVEWWNWEDSKRRVRQGWDVT